MQQKPERRSRLISEREDLIFLAALTVATGVAHEVATRVPARLAYAAALALALFAAVAPILINGAVGIVGSEDNDANRAFLVPPIVAGLAGLAALLRARWMAWAMLAAAIAQVGVFAWLWASGLGFTGPITVFFSALWLIAASLFRRAAGARRLDRA